MAKEKILVIGASGQIGTELVIRLRQQYGSENVVSADIKTPGYEIFEGGPYEILDVLDTNRMHYIVGKHRITQVYNLAALLSSTAEQNPEFGWNLNMKGLLNTLELAREKLIERLFWPSSIAVFGPNTPKDNTSQFTITEPTTVYGISKLAGERWCEYYHNRYGVDVRSLRYPGLIGHKSQPGGGTTDYAVHIFHEAIKKKAYTCFLQSDATLPMMYMDDAIAATIGIMEAPADKVAIRSSYNVAGMSFSPEELGAEIRKHIPEFTMEYNPDHRQAIAETWPRTIDDVHARTDWDWDNKHTISSMVTDMFQHIRY